jgi:hypothetical protein
MSAASATLSLAFGWEGCRENIYRNIIKMDI